MSDLLPVYADEVRLAGLLAASPAGRHGDLDPRVVGVHDSALRQAAVLVLLERGPGWRLVLTKRTTEVDHHKGEVSFAGGMRDPEDADARATALREAHEELGLHPDAVTVLGQLDDYVTITRFLVTPVVAVIDAGHAFRPNPAEVDRVLRVPLAHLRDDSQWFDDVREFRGERFVLRSCRYEGDLIWGATSRMLQSLLRLLPPDLLR